LAAPNASFPTGTVLAYPFYLTDSNGNPDLTNIFVQGDPTGMIDATASLQAAFTTLPAQGGKIQLTAGALYKVTAQITYQFLANQNIMIEGNGATIVSTVPETGGSISGIFAFTGDLNATAQLTVNNLTITHTYGGSGTGTIDGFYIQPKNYGSTGTKCLDRVCLQDVKISGCSAAGTRLLGAQSGVAINCNMSSNIDAGFFLIGCLDFGVFSGKYNANVTGFLTGDYGISLGSSSFLPYSDNVLIIGVEASSNGRKGIDVHHGHNVHIIGNKCKGNGYVGIYAVMEDSTKDTGDITIVGNTVDQTGGSNTLANYGINIGTFGTTGALTPGAFIISNNTISGVDAGTTGSAGIRVMTATTGVPPDRVVISNNTIKKGAGSAGWIILFDNALTIPYVEVANNVLHCVSCNVGVYIQSATDVMCIGNDIRIDGGTPQYGINIVTGANALVSSNQVNGQAPSSLAITNTSPTHLLRNNMQNGVALADYAYLAPFTVTGGLTVDTKGHLLSLNASTPTLTAVNANVVNQSVVGNDTRGVITFDVQTGTISAGTALFNLTFANAYGATPVIVLQDDSNQTTASFFCSGGSTTAYTLRCSAALGILTSYKISYFVIG